MTKMNQEERKTFLQIINQDLGSIEKKIREQIKMVWAQTRVELEKEYGLDKLIERRKEILKLQEELREELNKIDSVINSEKLTVQQAAELGGTPNEYGGVRGAHFFGIPVTSNFEYEIVQRIIEKINVEAPAKFLHDLGRSALREIAMCGTFEQAQKVYEEFYKLDFRKYGVDIPPKLNEIKKENPVLLTQDQELKLIGDKEK